jgi:hypothetical protein
MVLPPPSRKESKFAFSPYIAGVSACSKNLDFRARARRGRRRKFELTYRPIPRRIDLPAAPDENDASSHSTYRAEQQ